MMHNLPDTCMPVLNRIAERAPDYDIHARWPTDDLHDLAEIGAMKWAIGTPWGGEDLDPATLLEYYEWIASASLATALILSQRDAAAGYLEVSTNHALRDNYLPRLAANECWATIGISHLTTSNHSGTLMAERDGENFIVNGTIPWATGGNQSEFIVAGSKTLDDQQIVFVLPVDRSGVEILPAARLATLAAAPTSSIRCAGVKIEPALLIAGPDEKALSLRKRNLPLGQTFAALGLTRAALGLIHRINSQTAINTFETLSTQFHELASTVRNANAQLQSQHDLQSGPLIRSECNNLALRATHAAITLYKGSGLRIDHPAQRLAREAMFLLVWSSPTSVMDRNLELISEPH